MCLETILIQTGAQPAITSSPSSLTPTVLPAFEMSNHKVNVIITYNEAIENIKWKKLKKSLRQNLSFGAFLHISQNF